MRFKKKRTLTLPAKFFISSLIFFLAFLVVTTKVYAACCHPGPNCDNSGNCTGCVGANCEWDCGCNGDFDCGWNCFYQCCGGGCFTGETEIAVGESENSEDSETKQIKDLQSGDIVSSFNPETGEIKEGTVSDITKTTREGYYILETEGGYKVKVTGEHPFLAIKSEKEQESINQVSNFKNQLKEIFSNTLTYRFLANLQAKFAEAF